MFDDLEWHLKVISASGVIPTSSISEVVYNTSTETEITNKKSQQLLGDSTVNELGDISRSLDCFTSNLS